MQSTQWKNRTKSAGFSSFLSSYSTSQSKTDQNIVLNINGKKLAESTISNSSSIWDYNPDDLKVTLACPKYLINAFIFKIQYLAK